MHSNHIHITLAEQKPLALGCLGEVERKQIAAFFEYRRISRVEVFRPAVRPHDPSAKPDHIAAQVDDREYHPVSELVIKPAPAVPGGNRSRDHLLIGEPLAAQIPGSQVPAVGREPQPKPDDRLVGEPPRMQIVQTRPAGWLFQKVVIITGECAVQLKDTNLQPGGPVIPDILGHCHPGPLRQKLDRLHIFKVFDPADESDNVPSRAAAKTEKALVVRIDGKRGGFLGMERAEPGGNPPPPAKSDIRGDDLFNVTVVFQLLQKQVRNQGLPSFSTVGCPSNSASPGKAPFRWTGGSAPRPRHL